MTKGIYLAFIIFVTGTILAKDEVSKETKTFFDEVLNSLNGYRSWHDTSPLKLDDDMCKLTKTYLENWKIHQNLETLSPEYSVAYVRNYLNVPPNLNKIREMSGKMIIKEIYHTGEDYDYTKEPEQNKKTERLGVFTQILWKKTEKIGIAYLINEEYFDLVITFSPPGNIDGKYVENISPQNRKKKSSKKDKKTEPGSSSDPKQAKITMPGLISDQNKAEKSIIGLINDPKKDKKTEPGSINVPKKM